MFNFRKFGQSFKVALNGLKIALSEEQSLKIQLVIGVLVIFLMFYFPLSILEKAVLVLTIILVLSLELINSQIERILNFLQPNHDINVKNIKDLSAAAVLTACLGSILVGLIIFLPHLL